MPPIRRPSTPVPSPPPTPQPLPHSPPEDDGVRLAINLWDYDHCNEFIRAKFVGGRLDFRKEAIVRVDAARPDETAIVFICDLYSAALAIDLLRNENRRMREPIVRAYIKRKVWTRLPANAVLTARDGAGWTLSPEFFDPDSLPTELAEPIPLPAEPL